MFALTTEPVVSYQDDEGDEIIVKTDMELREAFRLCSKEASPPVLRFRVKGETTFVGAEHDVPELTASVEPGKVEPAFEPPENLGVVEPVITASVEPGKVEPAFEQLQQQFDRVLSSIDEFFSKAGTDTKHQLEVCQGQLTELLRTCDATFKSASSSCRDRFDEFKSLVEKLHYSVHLEDHLRRIQEEIVQVAAFIREKLFKVIASNDSPKALESSATSNESTSESCSLGLPSAEKDVMQLVEMGFTDMQRNINLLAKYKGDVAQVIDELLL